MNQRDVIWSQEMTKPAVEHDIGICLRQPKWKKISQGYYNERREPKNQYSMRDFGATVIRSTFD